MTEYDISRAFKRIESNLIKSIMDNLDKHRAQEEAEGLDWDMWQIEQLKELEKYRRDNADKFTGDFTEINRQIIKLFKEAEERGINEADSLRDLIRGEYVSQGLNADRVDALIRATTDDFVKAEHAVLRRANDQYRQIIFNAHVYAQQGGTYEEAVDMATKDFLQQGIKSIVYSNGARHNISEYASMALRTGAKRAYLMGFGKKMNELGIHTVRVNKRTGACPFCARWVGRVLVDDVYSGGTIEEAREKNLPLLSEAMEEGFLHPNCKDIYSMYIEGVSKPEKPPTTKEIQKMVDTYNREQDERIAKNRATAYGRIAKYSMTDKQRDHYLDLENKWADESNKKIKFTHGSHEWRTSVEDNEWLNEAIDVIGEKGFTEQTEGDVVQILWELPREEADSWLDEIEETPHVLKSNSRSYHSVGTVYTRPDIEASTVIHENMHASDYRWKIEYTKEVNRFNYQTLQYEQVEDTKKIKWSAYVDLQADPENIYDEVVDFFDYDVRPRAKDIVPSFENQQKYRNYMDGLKTKYINSSNYNEEFSAFLNARASLSDILAGITTNGTGAEQYYGYHTTSYWETQPFFADGDKIFLYNTPTRCTVEALANYAEIRTTYPKLLEELKAIVPDYYELLEEAYEEVLGIR